MSNRSVHVITGLLVIGSLVSVPVSHAASGAWSGALDSLWTNEANWSASPAPSGADTASFTNAGNGNTTVDLTGLANIKTIAFDTAGVAPYTLGSGGPNSQTLVMANSSLLQITSTAWNDQTVHAAVQLGLDTATAIYAFRNDSAFHTLTLAGNVAGAPSGGTAGTKTLSFLGAGNTLVRGDLFKGGATALVVTNASTGILTLSGSNTVKTLYMTGNANNTVDIGNGGLYLSNVGANTLYSSQGGTINGTGKIWMSTSSGIEGYNYADCYVAGGKTLVINPEITGPGGFELWSGSGTFVLNGINTFEAHITLGAAGTLSVSKIGNRGSTTSNLGKGSSIRFGTSGSKLLYTGAGESSDRILTFNSSAIVDQSGTGHLNFTAPPSFTAGAITITLQGSTAGTGELSGVVSNGSASASLTKSGTGTWTLSGANRLSGSTTVNAGTLRLAGADGSLAYSTNFIVGSGATLLLENSASANNADRLRNESPVTLNSGTLAFSHDAGSANYSEMAGTLIVNSGAVTITASQAASGQTSSLTFASLVRNGTSTVDFSGIGLGENDRNRIFITGQPDGVIGPWATVNNGSDFAAYDSTQGVVPAGTSGKYTDIAAKAPSLIAHNPAASVRITTAGVDGPIALSDATTAISTLLQNTTTDATIDTSDKTFQADSIVIPAAMASVTVGSAANDGRLTPATSDGSLLLANESGANLTVNAKIADNGAAAAVIAYGSGTVVLAGSNTFSGTTTTSGGPLLLANTYALQNSTLASAATFDDSVVPREFLLGGLSGSFNLALSDDAVPPNPVALAVGNNGVNTTLSGVLSGEGSLTKVGNGTLTLSGTNTHSGGTAILGGTVIASKNQSLGFGPVVVNDGTLNLTVGNTTYSGVSNSLSGNGTVNVTLGTGSNMTPLDGDYSGFTGIWNLGTGSGGKARMNGPDNAGASIHVRTNATLYCTLPATHNATLYLHGGNTGESYGQLRLEGFAEWAGPVTLMNDITDSADSLFGCNSGTGTVSGVISDFGGPHLVAKLGAGRLYFTATNTYAGQTWVKYGGLGGTTLKNVGEASSFGQPANAADGTIKLGNTTNAGRLVYLGEGDTTDRIIDLAGTTAGGLIDHAGSGLLKFTSALTVSGTGSKSLTLDGSTLGAGEFAGAISNGVGSVIGVTKSGAGTWTLTGTNGYSGNTTLNNGKLVATHQASLGTGAISFPSTATLELAYDSEGEYPYALGGNAGAVATLLLGGTTASGVRHTLGNFGISTITLNVQPSPSAVGGTPALTTPAVDLSAGGSGNTIIVPTDANMHIGSVSIRSNGGNPKGIVLDGTSSGNTVLGSVSNGLNTVSLIKANVSDWSLFGSNSYSGATAVNGGTLALYGQHTGGGATTVATNALYLIGGLHSGTGAFSVNGGTLVLSGTTGKIAASSGITLAANGTLTLANSAETNSADRLGDSIPATLAGGTFRFDHTGGPANYSETVGTLTVSVNSNTVATSQADSGQTSTITFAALSHLGGTVDFAGTGLGLDERNQVFFTAPPTLSGGIIGPWATVNGDAYATYGVYGVTAAADINYADLAAQGPDATIPDNANAHARIIDDGISGPIELAGTTISSVSTLKQSNTAIPATVATAGKTLLTTGLLIAPDGAALTIGASADDGTLSALTPGGVLSLINPSASTLTVNAAIADNAGAGINKLGAGPVVLSGACSYTGPTSINAGELVFGSSAPQVLPGAISGNGALTKSGTNVLHLLGANTYAGATHINAGTLRVNENTALGTPDAGTFIADGATLDLGCTPDVGGTRITYGLSLGTELITAQGTGVDGVGAIINSATGGQYNAVSKLDLAGDTSLGGTGRWDIRNNNATLNMNGHTVTKVGPGQVGITSATVNPGDGHFDITSGILRLESSTKLNGSSTNTVTVRNGGELETYQMSNPIVWSLILDNGASFDAANNSTASTHNRWAGPITLNGAVTLTGGSGFVADLQGEISGSGPLKKTGSANITISGTNNTYTSNTEINGGTLTVPSLRNIGEASPLGQPADAASGTIKFNSGTLAYTGTGETTDRTLDLAGTTGGAAIIQNGTGLLKFTSDLTVSGVGAKTLTLRGTKAPGEIAGSIPAGAGSTLGVTKSDTNEWTLSGNNSYSGSTTISAGTLTISGNNACPGAMNVNSGTLIFSGTNAHSGGNLVVGNQGSSNALMRILPGASISGTGGFYIGNSANSSAAVYMTGGEVYRNPGSAGDSNFGLGIGANTYGYFNMSDGIVTNKRFNIGGTGTIVGMGIARVTGGTLKLSDYILIARTNGCVGVLTLDGGVIDRKGATANISVSHSGGRGELNLTGGSLDNTGRNLAVRQNNVGTGSTGIVNVCAGSLTLNAFQNSVTLGTAWLNFNGGTLRAAAASATFIPANMTRVTVNGPFGSCAGGANIDTAGMNVTVAAPLQAPTGSGVATVALASQGSGYLGEPYVALTGGGGDGATAVANMEDDGTGRGTYKVASVTVTTPGWDYAAAPYVAFSGGGTTNPATASGVTLAPNVSGGLTKLGTGTLTLSAASTYSGMTTISNGTLRLGVANALPPDAPITLAGGTYDLGGFTVTNAITFLSGAIGNGTVRTEISPAGAGAIGTQILSLSAGANVQGAYVADVAADGSGDLVAVQGNIDLSGLALQIVDAARLSRSKTYTLLTCSGTRTGTFASTNLPDSHWHLTYQADGTVKLIFVDGTLLKLR